MAQKFKVSFTLTLDDDAGYPDDWLIQTVTEALENGESLQEFTVQAFSDELKEPK